MKGNILLLSKKSSVYVCVTALCNIIAGNSKEYVNAFTALRLPYAELSPLLFLFTTQQ